MFHAHVETLEKRRLLSVSLDGYTFTQRINGTAGDDKIWFTSEPATAFTPEYMPFLIVAHVNDSAYIFDTSKPLWIDCGAGNDRVEVPRFLPDGHYFLSRTPDYVSIRVRVNGGDGNDTIVGGARSDTLDGGAGDDLLIGNRGDDLLRGGDGNDTLIGGDGVNTYIGGAGNDTADFSARHENLNIQMFNDAVAPSSNAGETVLNEVETVIGGSGNDSIQGNNADNYLDGGPGNDTLLGAGGNDTLNGNLGDDTFYSADAHTDPNTHRYIPDNDRLIGGGGTDVAHVDQNDTLSSIAWVDLAGH